MEMCMNAEIPCTSKIQTFFNSPSTENIKSKKSRNRRRPRWRKLNKDEIKEIITVPGCSEEKEIIDSVANELRNLKIINKRPKSESKTMKKKSLSKSINENVTNEPKRNTIIITNSNLSTSKENKNNGASNKKTSNKKTTVEKAEFEPYITKEKVNEGIENKLLVSGGIRINQKDFKLAFISNPNKGEQDILVKSVYDRNRALDGDIVVVSLTKSTNPKENSTGKVVYIEKKVHSRTAVGTLKLMADKNTEFALFHPRDSKVPRIKIPLIDCPVAFYNEPEKYENVIFLAKIADWTDPKYAMGTILENVGMSDDIKVQTKSILLDFGLDVKPYPETFKDFYTISDDIAQEEIDKRLDLRTECIFTIDPLTARDLDDALSCKQLANGNYEIGVHISDVTHFLSEDTPLDKEVCQRATSIYMVESVYHMLPKDLCMQCSLLPGQDKLAFSVFWEITPEAEIISHKFSRTILNSCVQLAYEHAQEMLENPDRIFDVSELPPIHNGFTPEDLSRAVSILHRLSVILRKNRFNNGALRIDQMKVQFSIDPQTCLPLSYTLYENKTSHRLIEEFMLLANITVATHLHNYYPDIAFLRCHSGPNELMLLKYQNMLEKIGIHLDISNAGALHDSLIKYSGDDDVGRARITVLNLLCAKVMSRALYFCMANADDKERYWHYALNIPLYTHFTSPIRRYADIMVHRLLAASLGYREKPNWNVNEVEKVAEQCNLKKNDAKKAGEKSLDMYMSCYIHSIQPVEEDAVVFDVKSNSFDAVVLKNGQKVRVFFNNLGTGVTCNVLGEKETNQLSNVIIKWPAKDNLPEINQMIALFHVVKLSLKVKEKFKALSADIVRPQVKNQ